MRHRIRQTNTRDAFLRFLATTKYTVDTNTIRNTTTANTTTYNTTANTTTHNTDTHNTTANTTTRNTDTHNTTANTTTRNTANTTTRNTANTTTRNTNTDTDFIPVFAQYFENDTENIIPVGSIVTYRNDKIEIANIGNRIVGVVCINPNTEPCSRGTVRDRWNVELPIDEKNILKKDRPEKYTYVALLGKVNVRVEKNCIKPGDYLRGEDGIGVKCSAVTCLMCMKILEVNVREDGQVFDVARCLLK